MQEGVQGDSDHGRKPILRSYQFRCSVRPLSPMWEPYYHNEAEKNASAFRGAGWYPNHDTDWIRILMAADE